MVNSLCLLYVMFPFLHSIKLSSSCRSLSSEEIVERFQFKFNKIYSSLYLRLMNDKVTLLSYKYMRRYSLKQSTIDIEGIVWIHCWIKIEQKKNIFLFLLIKQQINSHPHLNRYKSSSRQRHKERETLEILIHMSKH